MKIIGQEKAVSNISRILEIFTASDCEVRPHLFLTGESGNSKSFIIKTLCERNELNFIEVNAAQLTKEGTSGNSLSKALTPLLNAGNRPTVVFADEFDKLFISGNSNSDLAHETTNGVQNEFLKVLEAEETSVFGDYGKYINANVGNVLFIFAGAFNGEENITLDRLRELGVKTEFLGRVGLVFNTEKLTLDNMYDILDESKLFKNYLALFPKVDKEQATYSLKGFIKENYETNTLGARMINTMVNQYFINGGKLTPDTVKKSTFQKTLSFDGK